MVSSSWTILWTCLLVASRSFVSTAPPHNGERQEGVDEDVRELQQLKPGDGGNSMSVMKSHSVLFTNINGNKQQHEDRKEQVEKNGELVARVQQQLDKDGQNAEPHVKTSLDIPSRNVHRVVEHGPKGQRPPVMPFKQPEAKYLQPYRPYSGMQYSPLDMAEYVFWTGDERGATSAIEEFLQDGLMTRDEAIAFLEEIKQNLELLKSQYQAEDRARVQSVTSKEKLQGSSDMSEIRQQMRENFNKKADYQDSPQMPALSDEDYEELVERLKLADLMYNEYSLEEVIYQLAKIMFRQSLSRGSVEAQDALQKFTDFLENEAQQGRISRALEKKVLDVVIASLSDTLTQHPELVEVARQSLGLFPEPRQYQPKQGISEGESGIPLSGQSHRFQPGLNLKEKSLQNSGLLSQDKKSN
ncbi:uncharacterized protein [Rhodnius prolixus]